MSRYTEAYVVPPHEVAMIKEAREDRDEITRLEKLSLRILQEAENISPSGKVHPAPVMKAWARALGAIVSQLKTK